MRSSNNTAQTAATPLVRLDEGEAFAALTDGPHLVQGAAGLRAMEALWRDLYDQKRSACSVFQSPDWCFAWCDANPSAEPLAVCIMDQGRLSAFLPLMIVSYPGLKVVQALGGISAEYMVPICAVDVDPSCFIESALSLLAGEQAGDVLQLDGLDETFKIDQPASIVASDLGPSFVCDLSAIEDYAAYLASRSSNSRSNIKRGWKRLKKLGEEQVVAGPISRSHLAAIYPELANWKRDWLRDNGVLGGGYDEIEIGSIYASLCENEDSQVSFRLVCLLLDDVAIAANTYLADGETLHCTGVYRDTTFNKVSVGTLMQDAVVKYALENGFRRIDYGLGENEDKRRNANAKVERYQFTAMLSDKGKVANSLGYLRLRNVAKSAFYQLPKSARQQIVSALRGRWHIHQL